MKERIQRSHTWFWTSVFFAGIFVLAGCGRVEDQIATATVTLQPTATASATAVPLTQTPTATATIQPSNTPDYALLAEFKVPFDRVYSPIDSGIATSCAVMANRKVKCWGLNQLQDTSQIVEGNMEFQSYYVDIDGLPDKVVSVAVAFLRSCALLRDGTIWCWGGSLATQFQNSEDIHTTPYLVLGIHRRAVAITAGQEHFCAIVSEGVVCWGLNNYNQLNLESSTVYRSQPIYIDGLDAGVRDISAGSYHTCAVTQEGEVVCWGTNKSGQVGNGMTQEKSEPVRVSGLDSEVIAVATGNRHSCALDIEGKVSCWGSNIFGQLGDGTCRDSLTPVEVRQEDDRVVSITGGSSHTCYITEEGTAKCWGLNDLGQLGDGSFDSSCRPSAVANLQNVRAVSAGIFFTCASLSGDVHMCWGNNSYNQLGNGDTSGAASNVPVRVR